MSKTIPFTRILDDGGGSATICVRADQIESIQEIPDARGGPQVYVRTVSGDAFKAYATPETIAKWRTAIDAS